MNKTCRQFPYRFTFESFIDNSSIPHPEKISRIFLRYPRYRSIYSINLLKPLERTSSVRRDYLNLLSTPQRSVQFLCGFHALTTCSAPNLPIVNSLPPSLVSCVCFPWKLQNFKHFLDRSLDLTWKKSNIERYDFFGYPQSFSSISKCLQIWKLIHTIFF